MFREIQGVLETLNILLYLSDVQRGFRRLLLDLQDVSSPQRRPISARTQWDSS